MTWKVGTDQFKTHINKLINKDSSITLNDVKTWLKRHPNKQRRPYKTSNSDTAPFLDLNIKQI